MNRLAQETSPYLLQHAENPVDWLPWGDEAFARAREDGKPLLVSIGYSACHWCHVMERESFEDEATAALLNELFVNVKVDREERPDVDAVYMDAVVALSGQGGWPLTVFLTPAGEPFYGGTYFPPEPRHGLPSFRQVLRAVADAYRERPEDVAAQAEALVGALRRSAETEPSSEPLTEALLAEAERGLLVATRPALGRLRPRTEVPARVGARVPAAAWRAGAGAPHARRDGGRRDVRPRRRRLPPLLRRRPVARAALREDALRQRAPRAAVPPRLAAHRRGPVPRRRRADPRLPGARAAPGERRLRLLAGRGHGRGRGADVHVDGGGGSAARAAGAVRARPLDPARGARRGDARAAARGSRRPAAAGARRQGHRRLERACARGARRGSASPRASRLPRCRM